MYQIKFPSAAHGCSILCTLNYSACTLRSPSGVPRGALSEFDPK